MLDQISNGRTDLVMNYLAQGNPANATDKNGTSLIQWCAYYGDVSSIKILLEHGELLNALGENFDLGGAAFHGHWRLCQFLIENGADPNFQLRDTGESPLHLALSTSNQITQHNVVKVLLANGAKTNCKTNNAANTGAFMRDCRTKGETPLHRAAAFSSEETIQALLDAGSVIDAKDMNGDSPLSWASWYLRPDSILRKLCYGEFFIRADRNPGGMKAYLSGTP